MKRINEGGHKAAEICKNLSGRPGLMLTINELFELLKVKEV